MFRLSLSEKSGFQINDPYKPVIIRDERGLLFYTTEYLTPKVRAFNLPPGVYFVDGGISKLEKPLTFKLYELPPFERFGRPDPKKFKIVWGDNPNKCSVFWDYGYILFDNSLKDYTIPELDFIRFHEYAHRRYKTEVYCDLMAANYMLCKGYNKSQIRIAPIISLSDKQAKRKYDFVKLTRNKNARG